MRLRTFPAPIVDAVQGICERNCEKMNGSIWSFVVLTRDLLERTEAGVWVIWSNENFAPMDVVQFCVPRDAAPVKAFRHQIRTMRP